MTGFVQHVRWTDKRASDRPALRWRTEVMLFVAAYRLPGRRMPGGAGTATTGADGKVTVTVPALSTVVYRAAKPIAQASAAPTVAFTARRWRPSSMNSSPLK